MIRTTVKIATRPPDAAKIVKQINYGAAVGLTKTAKEGQSAVQGALRGTFVIRGPWWQQGNRFGIKIKPAKPSDMSAEIRTRADWLEPHEKGGPKPKRGSGRFAIPTEFIRTSPMQKISKRLKPRNLKRTFVIKGPKGEMLFRRVTNYAKHQGPTLKGTVTRRRTKMGTGIEPVYALEPNVRIKRRSTFEKPIEKVVKRRLLSNINREVAKALAGMR